MMLRRATIEDYSVCKTIYDDFNNDMLYHCESSEETSVGQNLLDGIGDDPIFQEESHLTLERYKRFFDDAYGRLYVFEDDEDDVIGFITLYKISRFRWKLATVSVIEESQTLEVLRQIMDDLNNEQQIVSIEACVPVSERRELLKKAGFQSHTGSNFLKKTRKT